MAVALTGIVVLSSSCAPSGKNPSTISFKSKDGIKITADIYMAHPKQAPLIVLCHRSGWSRGEYLEIAPWLNSLGFNCLAIDQRAGGKINMVTNETLIEAAKKGRDTGYPDAEQDIIAALEYAKKHYAKGRCILWGSSYSASLSFVIAASNPGLTDGIVTFSPGEYFSEYGKPADYVQSHAASLKVPVFIAAMSTELFGAKQLFDAVPAETKRLFVPENGGRHGSESLWKANTLHEQYRSAVEEFLRDHFL